MSDHGHDHAQDDQHDDAVHGDAPLTGVDPAAMHAAVDALAVTLHAYVNTAVGVRAEFGAHEADEDPRILSLEGEIGGLNAALYDLLHQRLGMHADLTGMSWGDEEQSSDDAPADLEDVDTFHLGLVVGRTPAAGDRTLDSALDLVESAGAEVAQALVESGFEVTEWGVSRGAPVWFGEDEAAAEEPDEAADDTADEAADDEPEAGA